jgi:hypothetical protein
MRSLNSFCNPTLILIGSTLCALSVGVQAQTYPDKPNKPIKDIVPVAAGGGSDMVGRTVTERWGKVSYANSGWDAKVQHEGERTFFNWLGCAVGAATHEAPSAALAAAMVLQPAPQLAMRVKVHAVTDTSVSVASADVLAIMKDGTRKHLFVEHAIGSLQRLGKGSVLATSMI